MPDKLVIVESPAKARTIQKYLGPGFRVTSSMGHVRDLPKKDLAIDLAHDFMPVYEITKQKVVSELRQAVKKAEAVYLATDPDREGEAIAWHITQAVGIPRDIPVYRVVFQEITRNAVQTAVANPRQINTNLVDAQQARRVLDRLVGYQLSPLLWDKVKRGLSAGRVQSVAVRLIVTREQEIEAFKPVEYWTIEADLLKQHAEDLTHDQPQPSSEARHKKDTFRAVLIERGGKKLDKFAIESQEQAHGIVAELEHARYQVQKVTRKDKRRNPAPPFTTSTLQQEASRKLGFSARKTMSLAQQLYEGVDIGGVDGSIGLITYMRTDSTSVAQEAQQEAQQVIERRYGKEYLPEKPPHYKQHAKGAQEAHEAIRPTSIQRDPESLIAVLDRDMYRLYELIWKRFLASQMAAAIFDSTTVDIAAWINGQQSPPPYLFRATGSILKFPGFLAVYNVSLDEGEEEEDREKRLPPLTESELLDLVALLPLQHFTEPPPRYTEASLVKELERLGIGRPSTYAQIISTIQDREYVSLTEKKLIPTTLGRIVTDLLVTHFPTIVDYDFTSALEQELDDIAVGEKQWVPVLRAFYGPFAHTLEEARQSMRNVKHEEISTGLRCPKCQVGHLVIKFGRHGEFLACSRYSKEGGKESCDFTSDFHRDNEGHIVLESASSAETSDVMCNLCGRPMVLKKSRFGLFYGCSGYPECKNTRRVGKDGKPVPLPIPTGITCPKCHQGEILQRRGKFGRPFFGCSRYPDCDYTTSDLALVDSYTPETSTTDTSTTNGVAPTSAASKGSATATTREKQSPAKTGRKAKSAHVQTDADTSTTTPVSSNGKTQGSSQNPNRKKITTYSTANSSHRGSKKPVKVTE